MDIRSLKHVRRKLKSGGQVIVVDTGALLNAEALAMIQALHSRSIGGFDHHMEVLAEKGPEKFMETHYTGYGHKSIGDCGTATVFVEGVSMLVPKAIQDWQLYSGQESSTRFMDFSKQPFMNPLGTEDSRNIQSAWRAAYLCGLEWLKSLSLKTRFPRNEGEDEKVYEKAINARACDIMRAFLPAGTQTNLAWTMNLRQFDDELLWLRHHPLEEVREVAEAVENALAEKYPASFLKKRYEETEKYVDAMSDFTYFDPLSHPTFVMSRDMISRKLIGDYRQAIFSRPPKTELPRKIAECGMLQFEFLLDFGSFRDIQRHRSVIQQMPLLSTRHGFHEWYLRELEGGMRDELELVLRVQTKKINELPASKKIKQYYTPMGFKVANRLTGNLHALVYLVELRSTRFVHPTLRERALQIAIFLKHGYGIPLYLDPEPNRFDIRRGTHDIICREAKK